MSSTNVAAQTTENQAAPEEKKQSDKEFNFRQLEAKYERQLAQERAAREDLERRVQEQMRKPVQEDEPDDDEPYVNHKKLDKKLARFGEMTKQQTQAEIQQAVQSAIANEKRQSWLKSNADFYEVMQHAEKFAEKDPELAETILQMPEGFERQKLVYKTIKSMGLHQPPKKEPAIQEKIEANRRSPYYQPSGMGTAPYTAAGDFSESGKKNAFEKMQELKKRLRI